MSYLMRWDIINHLIKKHNYRSYLEIGYYKGWSFDRISVNGFVDKTAVDPNPSRDNSSQVELKYGEWMEYDRDYMDGPQYWLVKMTSDEFFVYLDNQDKIAIEYHNVTAKPRYDIIFIDGDHRSEQVTKDLQNSLRYLSPGGTIVMHDCNPPTELHSTTGTPNGEWCGDVYKAFLDFKVENHYHYTSYVIDTDYGVGVIKKREYSKNLPAYLKGAIKTGLSDDMDNFPDYSSWSSFDRNRKELLNLISPEEFLNRINETVESN